MENPSRYWQMRVLTTTGQLGHQTFSQAQQWFKAHFADNIQSLSERACQDALWHSYQTDPDTAPIAQLCLRCYLSHQIVYACRQLVRDFGKNYGFTADNLWCLVLDDDGKVPPTYPSLTIEILTSYNPDKAALSTWGHYLTKNHAEINKFLLELGLYRATPWAILNDTKTAQLPRFLPQLSQSELDIAAQLLANYHRVYRTDRFAQRNNRSHRCIPPTDDQLQRIDPHQPTNVVLSQLHDLAEQLRQSRIAARGGSLPSYSLDAQEYQEPVAPTLDETDETQSAFIKTYRQHFLDTLGEAIQVTVEDYIARYQNRKSRQGNLYRQALELFYCKGRSMTEIAKTLGLSGQVKVTRLLTLKKFRTQVCIYWLNKLRKQVQTDALEYLSVDELDAITDQLDQILREETQIVMDEAASEARIPKNRTTSSVFAKRICAVVPNLPLPPD